MSELTRYTNNDGIEIYINTSTGESFASIRGYARMAGVPYSTVASRVQGGRFQSLKMAEIQTTHGVHGGRLLDESIIIQWLANDAPDMLLKFAQVGVRMYLHQLAGYSVVSTAVQQPTKELTRRELLEMALEAELKLEAAKVEIDGLVEQVSDLTPRAIAWDTIADPSGLIKLNDFAGALGIGRTTLTRKLVDLGIMYSEYQGNGKRRNRTYAKHITNGRFVEKLTDVTNKRGDLVYTEFTTLITKAGAEWLASKF